jgi:DNA polymerase-3 subunit gamma/tau
MSSNYQVIARKYRPKKFSDVRGQPAIVETLKNAIRNDRIAQAYLFCGSHGTGKTTLARLFAMALNCDALDAQLEPCGTCGSCKGIISGSSMEVIEIDGASNRGIEDIRQINETVSYAPPPGKKKIYLIDEVHMLTKEAFNALLKTLEEPPPHVKFFFATTEPHKVLPTILSRCQRYNVGRIPVESIMEKLGSIATDMGLQVHEEALRMLAAQADGGLRDAESLFDQLVAFTDGKVTVDSISRVLGIVPRECFFELDKAGKEGDYTAPFAIIERVFTEGMDLAFFMQMLIDHFRTILLTQLGESSLQGVPLSAEEKRRYTETAKLYQREQVITLLELMVEGSNELRHTPSKRYFLESLLLKVVRSHQRLPLEVLVRRLGELESKLINSGTAAKPAPTVATKVEMAKVEPKVETKVEPKVETKVEPKVETKVEPKVETKVEPKVETKVEPKVETKVETKVEMAKIEPKQPAYHYDTLYQFAAVELDGTLQKK